MAQANSNSSKRHCMVVHAHYPDGETRVQRQAEALLRHGYSVDVVCLRGKKEEKEEICNGVRVIRLPVRYKAYDNVYGKFIEYFRFLILAMIKLVPLYFQKKYATIQLHNLPDSLIFAAWIPKLFGAKLILDLHDLMPEFYRARFGGDTNHIAVRLLYLQQKLSCAYADHVITVSKMWREKLINLGVPPEKCSVVMNVADHTVFHPNGKKRTPPTKDDGLHLIYHGAVAHRHGIDLTLQAVNQVRDQIPNIQFTIHGRGPYFRELKNMAQSLNLQDHVHFSDKFVPVEDLPDLIGTADVGLAPYRPDIFMDEIVPTKLMEYAALGMPAIAARTSGIEAYFNETMVELFTPGDVDGLSQCILKLYQDQNRFAQLMAGALSFNQQYNWETLGNEYVRLIDRVGGHYN